MTTLNGPYRALVVENVDPEGLGRVRVQVPQLMGSATSGWAYPVPVDATVPAIGSQVWVTFEGGDPSFPLYYGSTATDLTAVNSHLATIDTHLTTIDGEITTIQGDITTINGEIATLNGEVGSLNSNAVLVTGAQSVAGIKTFTDGIVVPAGDLPQSAISGLSTALPPTGSIVMYGAALAPSGWLLCDGSTFDSGTYPALAAVLGDTFGAHAGTTYHLPDFRQRFPLGVAAAGTGSTLGGTGGAIDHTHTAGTISTVADHTHSIDPPATLSDTQGSHSHGVSAASVTGTTSSDTHTHTVSIAAHTHSVDVASFSSGAGIYSSTLSSNVSTASSSFGPPGHYHSINPPSTTSGSGGSQTPTTAGDTHSHTVGVAGTSDAAAGHTHTTDIAAFNSAAGGGHTHTQGASGTGNPPFLAVNFIIKT